MRNKSDRGGGAIHIVWTGRRWTVLATLGVFQQWLLWRGRQFTHNLPALTQLHQRQLPLSLHQQQVKFAVLAICAHVPGTILTHETLCHAQLHTWDVPAKGQLHSLALCPRCPLSSWDYLEHPRINWDCYVRIYFQVDTEVCKQCF